MLYIGICYSSPPACTVHIISHIVACSVRFDLTPFSTAGSLAGNDASARGGCPLGVIPLHAVFPKFPKVKSVLQQLQTEPIRGAAVVRPKWDRSQLTSYRIEMCKLLFVVIFDFILIACDCQWPHERVQTFQPPWSCGTC